MERFEANVPRGLKAYRARCSTLRVQKASTLKALTAEAPLLTALLT